MNIKSISVKKINRDIFWNTAGSLLYALSSMILAFFVMNTMGETDGGIFGFGFSAFGQQMFIVAYFGIRPFHITDVKERYSFGEYRLAGGISSLAAALIAFFYLSAFALSGEYSAYKASVIFFLALYKITDGFADVYESECQRAGKLYLGGKALFLRTLLSMFSFMGILYFTESLLTAAFLCVFVQLLGLFLFNVGFLKRGFCDISFGVKKGKAAELFKDTLLLFISVFLDFYIFSSAKYAIDLRLDDASSGIFNILFMPTSFIYLVANFVIKPFMTTLALLYETGEREGFLKTCKKIIFIIGGLIALSVLATAILGGPVLRAGELVLGAGYEGSLTKYKYAFLIIILGGGFYALANFYYYILVIMRKQKAIFFVYLSAAIVAFIVSPLFVSSLGISGAALCYLFLMLSLCLSFAFLSGKFLNKA